MLLEDLIKKVSEVKDLKIRFNYIKTNYKIPWYRINLKHYLSKVEHYIPYLSYDVKLLAEDNMELSDYDAHKEIIEENLNLLESRLIKK